MRKNKKGQTLSMNTVIIGILVLVVLIVIIAFFVGGTGTVVNKIKGIFGGATGTDVETALQQCDQYCEAAIALKDKGNLPTNHMDLAYCNKIFNLDKTGDGKIDMNGGEPVKYTCPKLMGSKCKADLTCN